MKHNFKKYGFICLLLMVLVCMFHGVNAFAAEADWNDPDYIKMVNEHSLVISEENTTDVENDENTLDAAMTYVTDPFCGRSLNHGSKLDNATLRYGVDVSKWQGDVDWTKAKAAGVKFVIMRAGYTGTKDGVKNLDPKFEQNYSNCKALGLPVGVYYFSQAKNATEAKAEAEYVLSILNGRSLDIPVAFDYESDPGYRNYGLSKAQGTAIATAFCDVIRNAGYRTMVYANTNYMTEQLDASKLDKTNSIWIARCANQVFADSYTGYIPNYTFWQYACSDIEGWKGKIDGIGYVDIDCWYYQGSLASTGKAPTTTETEPAANAPATPSGLKCSASGGVKLLMAWNAVDGADGYELYRADGYGCTYSLKQTTNTNSVLDTGLTCGREYFYKVRAYKTVNGSKVYSRFSTISSGTTLFHATYQVKVSGTSSLNIRSNAGTAYSSLGYVSSGTTGTLLGVSYAPDGKLWYKVKISVGGTAVVGYGSSSYLVPAQKKVTNLKQTKVGANSLSFTWTEPGAVRGYEIWRAEAYNGTYTRVAVVNQGTSSYTDTGLLRFEEFFYKIRSYVTINGQNIYSDWSSIGLFRTNATSVNAETTVRCYFTKWNGTGYTIIATLPVGQKLHATQRIKDSAGRWWFYCSTVINGKTEYGFVCRNYIKTN